MTQCCPCCGFSLPEDVITCGAARYSKADGFSYAGKPVKLRMSEQKLVAALLQSAGEAVSIAALIQATDSKSQAPKSRRQLAYVLVSYARDELRKVGAGHHIQCVKGEGYRWAA